LSSDVLKNRIHAVFKLAVFTSQKLLNWLQAASMPPFGVFKHEKFIFLLKLAKFRLIGTILLYTQRQFKGKNTNNREALPNQQPRPERRGMLVLIRMDFLRV